MSPLPLSLSLGPLPPLSPSPSPPSDQAAFDQMMLAHPQAHLHPSLHLQSHHVYSQQAQGFDYAHPLALLPMSTPPPTSESPPPAGGKRYRAAPPKAFQCSGYGDCRMVFSRSEHLARHIRKHTGERPFACHCTKQFSRLDNLRQHAQTVHSAPEDKPRNEAMMRALATVNANMMAGVRGRRRFAASSSSSSSSPSTPADLTLPPRSFSSSGMPSPSYPAPHSPSHPAFHSPSHPYPHAGLHPRSAHNSPYPSPNATGYPPALLGAEYAFSPDEYAPHSGSDGYFPSTPAYQYNGVRVKEEQGEERLLLEETERDRGEEGLEGFYAALHGQPSSMSMSRRYPKSPLTLQHPSPHSPHPPALQQQQQQHHHQQSADGYLSASSSSPSQYSSPSGSPCAPTFWPSHVSAQGQGPYLPSPPQSPAYSVSSSHSSSAQSSANSTAEAGAGADHVSAVEYHWQMQRQQERQRGTGGEMSNAEYYAAVQAQAQQHGGTPLSTPLERHEMEMAAGYFAHPQQTQGVY
ncbi:hypothetical protein FB45DRAFT_336819 [Roridomyces roridus]|uniref:C2H2-type domain-containing protein n=1 Tax=Roridomyces roridus TaxID=1738132 RepID=A0AAD7F9A5_9AGAR|nr:hypothetical protein FB45DRAFT_336819 [Roridomyces roridus]